MRNDTAIDTDTPQVSTGVKWARGSGALPPPDPSDLEPPTPDPDDDDRLESEGERIIQKCSDDSLSWYVSVVVVAVVV